MYSAYLVLESYQYEFPIGLRFMREPLEIGKNFESQIIRRLF